VGRRRRAHRLTEGFDVPARARNPGRERARDRGRVKPAASAPLLGLEDPGGGGELPKLLRHDAGAPDLWAARGSRHDPGGGVARDLRPPRPARGGGAKRRRGLGGSRGAVLQCGRAGSALGLGDRRSARRRASTPTASAPTPAKRSASRSQAGSGSWRAAPSASGIWAT
jgi:hypothetical protein